jgi:hypothetical protein
MTWYWIIIILVGSVVGMLNLVSMAFVFEYGISGFDDTFNPLLVYEANPNINVFGCTLLTLFNTIIFLPWAIIYWFYKLCTVGRR